jgi:hypothetical protein
MSIWYEIIEEFKDFPQELRERLRQSELEREEEIVHQERARSIRRATDAFLEAKIPKESIIALLQKHWDLRRSEAEKALWQAENRAKRN